MMSRTAFLFLVAAAIVACESPLAPDELAGTYALHSTSASFGIEAPSDGEIVLASDGSATRRLRYEAEEGSLEEHVWTGRYRLREGRLELALSHTEDSTEASYRPVTYDRGMIVLRGFPTNDGPEIVEVYLRR